MLALSLLLCTTTAALDWTSVEEVLQTELANKSFPGAVGLVLLGDEAEPTWTKAIGDLTYDATSPKDSLETIFDLASLTKVIGTTTACMILYQRGLLHLDTPVSDPTLLGPGFGANGKASITVRNLLLHNSGFPPDPIPQFWSAEFNCSQTSAPKPPGPALSFDCVPKIYTEGILNQSLINPVGAKFVYSDLSMITMMFVVGTLVHTHGLVDDSALLPHCMAAAASAEAGTGDRAAHAHAHAYQPWQAECYYEAFLRTRIFGAEGGPDGGLGMKDTRFLPPPPLRPGAAPACVATAYRACPMRGEVSDGNAFALGGVAGHAGLFSTAADLAKLARRLMYAPAAAEEEKAQEEGGGGGLAGIGINATTVRTFTTMHNRTQSSRALGWDTNDYTANTYRGCANLSATTFTHTGYTGTQVCCDPVRRLVTILLTNRCYPDDNAESHILVHHARQRFNNAVMKVVDNAV